MQQFTHEERLNIIHDYNAASQAGKDDDALKIIQQLPIAPHIARAVKEVMGTEYLLNSGFDLSEAEAKYGKNWLNN